MVIFSVLEEKVRISVTVEFIPRSSISIFVVSLKHFALGILTKANAPPAYSPLMAPCVLNTWLPFSSVHRPLSFSHFCIEQMLN